MPVYDRNKINGLIKEINNGASDTVYLFCGDRYLCQQAADQICEALCSAGGTVHTIDGDTEDSNATLSKLRSFSLLPGRQVFRVNDSRLFHSKNVAKSIWNRAVKAMEGEKPDKAYKYLCAMMEAGGLDSSDPGNDPGGLSMTQWKKCFTFAKPAGKLEWTARLIAESASETVAPPAKPSGNAGEMLQTVLAAGIPPANILLLLAEEVDKRKKLYKFFKDKHTVINLSVDVGATAQAKKAQQSVLREQVNLTLHKVGKTMAGNVMEQLFERVGFHPVAVVMETEKLALYVGDAPQITLDDLNTLVGRTRQEAVFELTQAIGDRKLESALLIASRLQDNGVHGLAVLATLRNFTRSLLLFRALQEQPKYGVRPNMAAQAFQNQCLSALKENPRWQKEMSGHPFAVYMKFKTASAFPLPLLKSWLRLILDADKRLKGSPIDSDTVLQHLIISMLTVQNKGGLQNRY